MHLMSERSFLRLSRSVSTPNPMELAFRLSMNPALAAALKYDRHCFSFCLFNFFFSTA